MEMPQINNFNWGYILNVFFNRHPTKDKDTGNPAYANDIAIVTLHRPVLQQMLNPGYNYSPK